MTNFSSIPSQWSSLADTLLEAERHVNRAPLYAAMLCRKSLEEWIRWLYEHDADLEFPYEDNLSALLHAPSFKNLVAPIQLQHLNLIRKLGNAAVHSNARIKASEALYSLKLLHGFIRWVCEVYSEEKPSFAQFDETLVPKIGGEEKSKKELLALEEAYQAQQEKLEKLEAELEAIQAIKEQNLEHIPPPTDPDEYLTRTLYIDILLREAGWDPFGEKVAEYPVKNCMPRNANNYDGHGYVDYVLWGQDGSPLAVVEAKRTRRDPRVGQQQAKCYADCLEKEFGQRPVIFYSNGFKSWIWDDTGYPPREVQGFYTHDELAWLIQRRSTRKDLKSQEINSAITDRYYQHEAIRKVGEAFSMQERGALLVMATGSGKTRVAASIIDFLSKAGWVKRVLFLADRNALVHQAKNNLNDYLPQMPAVDLTREKEDESSRLVFCTYQTMINLIDGESDDKQRFYGVGHFDLVIFDEIHRSVYNRYRAIFDYFDGLRLGLTATPKTETNKDTYELFHLEPNIPTYAYELDQAVEDKFLVPPKGITVPTKFHRSGIKYADLSEDEKEKYEAQFADPMTGYFPDEIDATALNEWLFNKDTVDKAIGYLMENGIKVEGGDKLAKTIIFARSHKHSTFIQERFNLQYPHYKGEFLRVIDYQEEYRYDLLNRFKAKDKFPQIATSVDMLDTGIDIPEVCNLVFFKPIRSKSKYWQMIGRGTRLCTDLFGPGMDKQEFVIFDFCENFEFFSVRPQGFETSTAKSLSQRLFELRLKLAVLFRKSESEELKAYSKHLFAYLIRQTQSLATTSFIVRKHWEQVERYRDAAQWNALSDSEIHEIIQHIAPLVVESDQDESAKQWDALTLSIQHELAEGRFPDVLIDKVKMGAERLTKKASIPIVKAKMPLIQAVSESNYWHAIDVLGVEQIRTELRDLMKFLEKEIRPVVYSDYEDELTGPSEFDPLYGKASLHEYQKRAKRFLKEYAHHIVINKLRNNTPITPGELEELERLLFIQGKLGSKEEFEQAFGKIPLGHFIRSIFGLNAEAARTAFSEILSNSPLNSQQIRFLDTVIRFFTVRGVVEPAMLFEAPFTDINTGSVSALFDEGTSHRIIKVMEGINQNAG
ncbi:MAG TPA: hypothetical protein DIW47_12880 [Bacteroidetes bacterium]|nr:hypothetical protein [Bacteroidota bacterium]